MANKRAQVLVVDDERFFREAIRDALTVRDFECVVCEDGEAALNVVAAQSFAVAVIDARLPGMDGIELLQQLRLAQPDMQVIVLSSAIDQELVLEALRFGAGEYLGKPLHDEELVLAVERAVQVNGLANDRRRLRARLDDLVERIEDYAGQVNRAGREVRQRAIRDGAVATVARALGAEKTSLLLVDDDENCLEVAAVYGRDLEPAQMDPIRIGEGIAGRAFEDSAPLVVADIRAESHFAADLTPDRYATNSFLMSPVALPSRQFGLLCATDRSDGNDFDHDDLSVMRAIAVHVAEFLYGDNNPESANHVAALDLAGDVADVALSGTDTTARDAELARAICDVLVNEMDPAALVPRVLHAIEVALGADPVALFLVDSESGELVLEGTGPRGLRWEHERLPVGRGLIEGVLVRGQLVAVADPEQDPRFDASVDAPVDKKSGALLAVPLKLRGKTVGVCRVHLPLGEMISARTGEMLAAVLSAAVRNMLLYRSLLESIEEVAQARREARS